MLKEFAGPTYEIPRPRHTGGRLLFLDYDGVLHPENVFLLHRRGPTLQNSPGHQLFEHCALLEELLASYSDVRIVLSTSWVRRYRGSIHRVSRRLTPGLQARVIGATYHSRMDVAEFSQAPRGMQIWADVLRRTPSAWLALDDDYLHWPAWCREQLVRTDPLLGISEPHVLAELKRKLEKTFGGDGAESDG
ncbi:hypothetical protein DID96_02665 [Burkholderia sp. Bp8963]|uniref:HAD domain-containing protein n=1 Tax=Burkholderia sp. Bp8963 TaxID=2184547 RepID=UPI000F5A4894|nr:HAD domain-containing protein [Burkholderia sp. Bp8963]RQS76189.1 hypothetical protein DID96_02665 [Burkholderia sp. Bp8963]